MISVAVVVFAQEGETQTTDSQTQLLQMLRKRGPCEACARSLFNRLLIPLGNQGLAGPSWQIFCICRSFSVFSVSYSDQDIQTTEGTRKSASCISIIRRKRLCPDPYRYFYK